MTHLLLEALDPFRKPTWKWDVAGMIHTGELDRKDYDDAAILAAVDYLQGTLQGARKATIRAAFQLKDRNTPARWTLEARLLAGESNQAISRKTGLSPEVVVNFETLFFHVHDVLGKHDFLLANVIGGGPIAGFQDNELREFWCWLAIGGGPIALDFVLDQFPRVGRSGKQVSLADYFHPRSQAPLELQAFVATSMIPLAEQTAWFFAEIGIDLLEATNCKHAQELRRRIQKKVINAARKYLAGKPLGFPTAKRRGRMALAPQDATEQRNQLLGLMSAFKSPCRANNDAR